MFVIQKPTFGTDFEIGVRDKDSRKIMPVLGFLGGTKDKPKPIGNDCAAQEDGPMAEFNIPPCTDVSKWVDYTYYCMGKGNEILGEKGLELVPFSSHIYDDEQLQGELRTLGCSPSWNAYLESQVTPDGDSTNLRTCGYHIHVGFPRRYQGKPFSIEMAVKLAKYFDLHMGVPSVILDEDNLRRKLYGKSGDFRNRTIRGPQRLNLFEYRSLGGNLLTTTPLIKWAFTAAKRAVDEFSNQGSLPHDSILQNTIDNGDKSSAKELIEEYNLTI